MKVYQIVIESLHASGHDGLVGPYDDCACSIRNIEEFKGCPLDGCMGLCEPAHRAMEAAPSGGKDGE